MPEKEFLPQGFILPDGSARGRILASDSQWQIVKTSTECSALIVSYALYRKWVQDELIGEKLFASVNANGLSFFVLVCRKGYLISSVQHGPYPQTSVEAHAFAVSLREMRKTAGNVSFHDAVYLEQFSLLLPAYTQTESFSDEIVLGEWLSSGVHVQTSSFSQLCRLVTWLTPDEIKSVIRDAGLDILNEDVKEDVKRDTRFSLPGRPMLETFFNEHVIEIIRNEERYRRVGINFPSAIVLYGSPGCGKTFAVDKLIKFLGWPHYSIDSGTIGSPYIHDTGRKTAAIFEEAARNSPAVIVIDEMDAFLSGRTNNDSGVHHTEEVSEFLRRIPEAPKNHVLVIAMTNRIDVIDAAALRHGRFDHIIEVTMPSAEEVKDLLNSLFEGLPLSDDVDLSVLSEKLAGHPLSDAAFIVKEAGRLAVRKGKELIDALSVESAYKSLSHKKDETRRIGF